LIRIWNDIGLGVNVKARGASDLGTEVEVSVVSNILSLRMNLQRKCEDTSDVNASRWVFIRLLALLSAE